MTPPPPKSPNTLSALTVLAVKLATVAPQGLTALWRRALDRLIALAQAG